MVEQQRQYAEYQKQREASACRRLICAQGRELADVVPRRACGGDERSKDLIESYMTDWTRASPRAASRRRAYNESMARLSKGVAQWFKTLPQLKKAKDSLKFGRVCAPHEKRAGSARSRS